MPYNEASFQTEFNKWVARHPELGTCAFELKITQQDYLNFKAVQPHQLRGLKLAKKRIIYKIPDAGMGKKPFDSFVITGANAYVVILYYTPRQPKEFVLIDVHVYEEEMNNAKRASLTKERAFAIGKVFTLNE